ncbi:MAG: hypothetical protein WCT08_00670 [Patescibacteria group bacterium]|jgi:(p)ppGpp synthase/HD superfamily hydrolase
MRRQRIGYTRKVFTKQFIEKLILSKFNSDEIRLIMLAWLFSEVGHKGQTRKDGITPYAYHPLRVVLILMLECGVFLTRTCILGFIHDLREDSEILTDELVRLLFGEAVLADWLTISKFPGKNYFAEFEKASWLAILVKLADRLDNLRDFKAPESFRREYIAETEANYFALIRIFERKAPKRYKHLANYFRLELNYALAKVRRSLKKAT